MAILNAYGLKFDVEKVYENYHRIYDKIMGIPKKEE